MKFLVIFLAIFIAFVASQSAEEQRRKYAANPSNLNQYMEDITIEEKEAIHEAVRLLSMQHHIDPRERTDLLKQLMVGEIDFKEALKKAQREGDSPLELDTKYAQKIEDIAAKLQSRRSRHVEDLQRNREEMRARRKARLDARNEM